MTNYVMFSRPAYHSDDGNEFEITISRSGVYCCAGIARPAAAELVADIQRHLDLDPGRSMEWGDLGLTDPDDIAF